MENNRPPSSEARKRQTSPVVSTTCRSLVTTCGRMAGKGGREVLSSAQGTGGIVILVHLVSGRDAHFVRAEKGSRAWPGRSGCNAAAWRTSASNRLTCRATPESPLRDAVPVSPPPSPPPTYDASCAKKDHRSAPPWL